MHTHTYIYMLFPRQLIFFLSFILGNCLALTRKRHIFFHDKKPKLQHFNFLKHYSINILIIYLEEQGGKMKVSLDSRPSLKCLFNAMWPWELLNEDTELRQPQIDLRYIISHPKELLVY